MSEKPAKLAARYRRLAAELQRIEHDPREFERAQQIRDELQECWWKMGPKQRRAVPVVSR